METMMTVFEFAKGCGIILAGLSVLAAAISFIFKIGKIFKGIENLSVGQNEMKGSIKELKDSMDKGFKELHEKLEVHGNRLTAIETTLRLADWFVPYHDHEREKAEH